MELSSAHTQICCTDSGMTQYLAFPADQHTFRKYLTTEKNCFFLFLVQFN